MLRVRLTKLALCGLVAAIGLSSAASVSSRSSLEPAAVYAADETPSPSHEAPASHPEQGGDDLEEESPEECELHALPFFQFDDDDAFAGGRSDRLAPSDPPQTGARARVDRPPETTSVG